jgi:hypothetical protein
MNHERRLSDISTWPVPRPDRPVLVPGSFAACPFLFWPIHIPTPGLGVDLYQVAYQHALFSNAPAPYEQAFLASIN